jgi:hypothetical protein
MMQERKAQRKQEERLRRLRSVRQRTDFILPRELSCRVMADSETSTAKLGDIIDYIEKMREELLTIQRSLEKLEPAESAASEEREISR